MKSLEQIEPRTIINASNTPGDGLNTFIISQPGSYYFVADITGEADKHGIRVETNDVTIDLNGFALVSGGGNTRGIDASVGLKNLCIRNGTVRGWSGGGIRADGVGETVAERLRLMNNAGAVGIAVGLGSLIKDCVANGNAVGFKTPDRSHIANCISTENTGNGFEVTSYVTILDCTSSRNQGIGIKAGGSCSILRSSATRNDVSGIVAEDGCTISDCTASWNVMKGITAPHAVVTNCSTSGNGGIGIEALRGSVTNCSSKSNSNDGIVASEGTVSNSTAHNNLGDGIDNAGGSTTNCSATRNGNFGVVASGGVLAFCRAADNNQNNNGSDNFFAFGASRTGNNPGP
jgi:hypothetical protein